MNGNILINNDCTDFSAEGYAALGVLLEMVWGIQTMGGAHGEGPRRDRREELPRAA